jgi:hypothetical protein
MKKQINSVSNFSVKSILSAAILCAMFGASGVNANNNPSVKINNNSRDIPTDIKAETAINKGTAPARESKSEVIGKNEMTLVIEQWMEDRSYWSQDDSSVNHLNNCFNGKRPDNFRIAEKIVNEKFPFTFNAASFIPESEF